MSKKSKIIISLSIVAFVVVSALLAVVTVFAAESEVVERNIDVTYKINNISGSVTATYKYGDKQTNTYSQAVDMTSNGLEDGEKVIKFYSQTNQITTGLKPQENIVLTAANNSVIFQFNFANIGVNGYNAAFATMNKDFVNCEIEYSFDGINWSDKNYEVSLDYVAGITNQTSYFVRVSKTGLAVDTAVSADFVWTMVEKF